MNKTIPATRNNSFQPHSILFSGVAQTPEPPKFCRRSSHKQLPINIPIPARSKPQTFKPCPSSPRPEKRLKQYLFSLLLPQFSSTIKKRRKQKKNMGFLNLLSTRILLALLCLSIQIARAQTTTANTATPSSSASIYPGTTKWEYHGCYNETTGINGTAGLRALSGGTTDAVDTMSVPVCLNLCEGGNYAFAGLEYRRFVFLLFPNFTLTYL